MRQINAGTWAPLCPVSEGDPAALLLPCVRGRGSRGDKVPGLSPLWPGLNGVGGWGGGGSCVLGVNAHVTHTSPPPLYTSPSEGFMESSSYTCPPLFLFLFDSPQRGSWSFIPSCSFKVIAVKHYGNKLWKCFTILNFYLPAQNILRSFFLHSSYPPEVWCSDRSPSPKVTEMLYFYNNSDELSLPAAVQHHLHPDLHFCQAPRHELFYFDANYQLKIHFTLLYKL